MCIFYNFLSTTTSIVDGERWSAAKKSHASADSLATVQQELLQLTPGLAFAISAVNLCVLVEAVFIVSCFLQEC